MNFNILNVSAFMTDKKSSGDMAKLTELRNKTLAACDLIPGYRNLSRADKNKIYDLKRVEIAINMGIYNLIA